METTIKREDRTSAAPGTEDHSSSEVAEKGGAPETRLDDDGNGGRRKVLAAASSGSIHGLGLSLCDPMAARPQVWPLLM